MVNELTVHVIDDDDAMRDSLSFLLAAHSLRARTYPSAAAFLDCLDGVEPGCIVTDVRMPGVSGMALLQRIGALRPCLPVIVITGHGDVPLAVEAMKRGAIDFIEKPFNDEHLIAAVNAALDEHKRCDDRASERQAIAERLQALSGREREVLSGLVEGKANKVIALDLGISPRTVEVYRANLMAKTQAQSLSELVRMAIIADGG